MNVLILHMSVPVSPDAEYETVLSTRLSPGIIEQARRFHLLRRRIEFLAGRTLLSEGLARLGCARSVEDIIVYDEGKPRFEGGPFFSISHSGGLAACALSEDAELGLDVQVFRSIETEAFRPWFSPAELAEIREAANPDAELIRRWSAKEALFKAAGVSGTEPLPKLPPGGTGPVELNGAEWHLVFPEIDRGHAAALAVYVGNPIIEIEEIC